ncbi:AraC family transcriptional regulator [Myroides sp. M-43]|uniref:helix-turn-helix domain-containing protein n=1 Tax=Myroides oncorhynchi TaxID=2893756 RepID=UPI001E60B3A4|nr:AraC family transcriptional regulator [Myroides oncorhynchi]MCC9043617.1 AraC family transcriptional regulator [Myroides oncorhynchi]
MSKTEQKVVKRGEQITQIYFQYLDKHINDVISGQESEFFEINQIANQLALSHQHLTDTIQRETGNHPCYFYDQKIIQRAIDMLLQTDQSIAKIALILTYDPSNFSKFFKKITGLTPGQYRIKHK